MRGRFNGLALGALLMLIAVPAWAMPQALVYVGSLMLGASSTYVVVAGVVLIVAGMAWGQSEQRKAERDAFNAQRDAFNAALKDRMATVITGDSPYVRVYGKDVAVGSRIVDVYTSGARDQYHHLICVLADHESAAIHDVAINDKWLGTLDANGYVTAGDYYDTRTEDAIELHSGTVFDLAHVPQEGTLQITYHIMTSDGGDEITMPYVLNGTQVTVAADHPYTCSYQYTVGIPRVRVIKRLGVAGTPYDATTYTECAGEYLSTSVWEGKTVLIVRVDLDTPELANGIPTVKARMDGALLHDPRDPAFPNDVPTLSENNALVIADYLMSEMCSVPYEDLPLDSFIAAANDCDSTIVIDGQTVPRYTFCGTITSTEDPSQVLEAMANSMAGGICGTTWTVHAGVWTAPVMNVTQDDILENFGWVPGSAESDLFNTVKGTFIGEENLFVPTDYTPYTNQTYLAADGEEKAIDINFPYTKEQQRIHNICRIKMEDQRNAFTMQGDFKWRLWGLEIGQRVTFDSAFIGQAGKYYRVTGIKRGWKQPVWISFKEDAPSIYDGADAVVVDQTPNTNLPNPWQIAAIASLTCSSGTDVLQIGSDGSVTSRILVEWPQATTQGVVHGGYLEVEWRRNGAAWTKTQVTGDATSVYLSPVKDKVWYQIRIRCVNPLLNVKSGWIYTRHQVVGKTERPSQVPNITAQATLLNVLLRWDEITDIDRRDYLIADDTGGVVVYVPYQGNEAALPPASAGLHTYRIVARDTSKLTSAVETTCQLTINAPDAPAVDAQVKDGIIELTWNDCTTDHQILHYELRYGTDYETGTFLARASARAMRITPDWIGVRQLWLAGVDIAHNTGVAGGVPVAITVPDAPAVSAEIVGDSVKLTWDAPGSYLPVDLWEVRYGDTWAGGTSIGKFRTTSLTLRAAWLGTRQFMVAAIDIANNTGTPGSVDVNITGAPAPVVTTEVIDNNAILRWNAVQGTLPTKTYEIRRGATFATATVIGTKNGTFDIAPETVAGVYTYWVVALDSADNYGAPGSAAATVSQPPDYILRADLDSDFSGTKINLAAHGDGSWIAPVDETATVEQHFARSLFQSPDNFAAADWTKTNTTVTTDALSVEGGAAMADKLCSNATPATQHYIRQDSDDAFAAGVEIVQTVRCKAGELDEIYMVMSGSASYAFQAGKAANFNLLTGVVSLVSAGVTTNVTDLGGGEYEFSIKATTDQTSEKPVRGVVYLASSSGTGGGRTVLAAPAAGDGVYLWQHQIAAASATLPRWATPQDQINAGFPIYIQPNLSPAYYEEVVDYGAVLSGTRINVTLTALDLVGAVTKSCRISVSTDGVSYTDYDGVWQVYASAFRYVKYRLTFTASNSTDLIEIEKINYRLDVKFKTVSIPVTFAAGDAGGTTVYLTDDGTATGNKLFLDAKITFQPYGTARRDWIVDFTDVPNPLSCKVLVWDTAGTRVSGSGCLTVGGS